MNRNMRILLGSDEMEITELQNTEQKTGQSKEQKPKFVHTHVIDIGKPYTFRKEIDANGVGKETLEKKLGILEITPCKWHFPIPEKEYTLQNLLRPKIQFHDAIQDFQNDCQNYRLKSNYSGVKLHLTQPIQMEDTITNTYDVNSFESVIDTIRQSQLGRIAKTLRSYDQSLGSQVMQRATDSGIQMVSDFMGENFSNMVNSNAKSITDVLLMQHKISFPRIWKDSDYTPNISVRVKLFSPYGHPEAINKFIISPLCYLILLCAPRTRDGLSFGHPRSLYIRGYGNINIPLSYPRSISWQRTGDDHYTIYRQPTTVEVNMSFESLIGGFGYYTGNKQPNNERRISDATTGIADTTLLDNQVSFMTLGSVIESFRPHNYTGS